MNKSLSLINRLTKYRPKLGHNRSQSNSQHSSRECPFGLLLDIDGVITRGKSLLPRVQDAFRLLIDKNTGKFRVPTVFVTNAGNLLRVTKANKLSQLLGVEISVDQMIVSHSPLRMFTQFHHRHALVVGQGPILDIAHGVGFTRVVTTDDVRAVFPNLDMVDHRARTFEPSGYEKYFPPIEVVVLFGPPVRWESHLQLIVDILMSNGNPYDSNRWDSGDTPDPHLPVLACNTDLLWMSDATLPRFAHGTFLLCLEGLYKKLTGNDLKYSAVIGKPSELTYHHAEFCLTQQSVRLGLNPPRTIYAIGDNPESDVLGANLFHQVVRQRHLQQQSQQLEKRQPEQKISAAAVPGWNQLGPVQQRQLYTGGMAGMATDRMVDITNPSLSNTYQPVYEPQCVQHCYSVLVETGVYSKSLGSRMNGSVAVGPGQNHSQILKIPSFYEADLMAAVQMIFKRESFN